MFERGRSSALILILASGFLLAKPSGEATDLNLSISSATDHIMVYEPLPMTVVLENHGHASITYADFLFNDSRSPGVLRITRPDGSAVLLRRATQNWTSLDVVPSPTRNLHPGQREVFDLVLSCTWGMGSNVVFDRPGDYSVSAFFEGDDWRVEANEIVVTVIPPPPEEVEALELLRTVPVKELIYAPEEIYVHKDPSETPSVERLARAPGSVYASYARLALGKAYRLLAEREKDPSMRLLHLENAERWMDEIDTARFTLAREVVAERRRLTAMRPLDARPR